MGLATIKPQPVDISSRATATFWISGAHETSFRSIAFCQTFRFRLRLSCRGQVQADGRVEAGFFLLDVFCLGVKAAGFHRFSSVADYQESLLDRFFHDEDPVRMTPAVARKLAEDAVSYASGLGFSPGTDYKKASRVFGGITTALR